LDIALSKFAEYYQAEYRALMLKKLGFEDLQLEQADEFLRLTITFLHDSQVGYHQFFADIAATFSSKWRDDPAFVMNNSEIIPALGESATFDNWCFLYHQILNNFDINEMDKIAKTLTEANPKTALLRPVIESIWEPITEDDNWQPFYDLVGTLQTGK
jgi:uncharacterized protein YdiU (UPF0061 family)